MATLHAYQNPSFSTGFLMGINFGNGYLSIPKFFIYIKRNHAQKGNEKHCELNEIQLCFISFRLKEFDREKPHFLYE